MQRIKNIEKQNPHKLDVHLYSGRFGVDFNNYHAGNYFYSLIENQKAENFVKQIFTGFFANGRDDLHYTVFVVTLFSFNEFLLDVRGR